MNKRAILKKLLNDETIKSFYKEDWDRSTMHNLMLEEEEEEYIRLAKELFPSIANREDGIKKIKSGWKDIKALRAEKERRKKARISGFKRNNFDLNDDGVANDIDTNIYNKTILKRQNDVDKSTKDLPPKSFDDLLVTDPPKQVSVDKDSDIFISTPEVEKAVKNMVSFYDQPYLYQQGEFLRALIVALQNALKEEEKEAGIRRTIAEDKKNINIKNIKASLNAFLQQTRKVKKALAEYIEMAKEGKTGSSRKKSIMDKEVDKLISYGKKILKSLPETISETKEESTSESGVSLQPLHDFINFITSDKLKAINKSEVAEEIKKVKPILKIFPNVAPFGQASDLDVNLDQYMDKFEQAINSNLRTSIANFKSLQSEEGGTAAIDGLRDSLIDFLSQGLAILGKNADGDDLKNLKAEESVEKSDDFTTLSDESSETIKNDLSAEIDDTRNTFTQTLSNNARLFRRITDKNKFQKQIMNVLSDRMWDKIKARMIFEKQEELKEIPITESVVAGAFAVGILSALLRISNKKGVSITKIIEITLDNLLEKNNEESLKKYKKIIDTIDELKKEFDKSITKSDTRVEFSYLFSDIFSKLQEIDEFKKIDGESFINFMTGINNFDVDKSLEKIKLIRLESLQSPNKQEQIQRNLEVIVEGYINNRKQQWRKRTM